MRHLLDVNVLLALALAEHDLHHRVVDWLKISARESQFSVATCSITELGFVRILSQPIYGRDVNEALQLLKKVKTIPDLRFSFMPDEQSALQLPKWVERPSQVTDGHLFQLAASHGGRLATLDEKIPGAFLIPG